jgi:hypothetical protein
VQAFATSRPAATNRPRDAAAIGLRSPFLEWKVLRIAGVLRGDDVRALRTGSDSA